MAVRRLDRKARTAVVAAGALILAAPLFVAAKITVSKLGDDSERQVFHPENDQLVELRDGSTMLVKGNSFGHRVAHWLNMDAAGQETFELGNKDFAPSSANPTHDGWAHLTQFAHLLKVHPTVSAVVLFSPHHGDQATLPLEHMRAVRIHDEVVRQGVDERQIAVTPEGFDQHHNAAQDEGLEVVLTNKG